MPNSCCVFHHGTHLEILRLPAISTTWKDIYPLLLHHEPNNHINTINMHFRRKQPAPEPTLAEHKPPQATHVEHAPLRPSGSMFPPVLNAKIIHSLTKRNVKLCSEDGNALYAVSFHSRRPHLILHNGSSTSGAEIATCSEGKAWKMDSDSTVVLSPLGGFSAPAHERLYGKLGVTNSFYNFAVDVGGTGGRVWREEFQWQSSKGAETTAGGRGFMDEGHKLVRVQNNEVVAVWVAEGGMSMSKVGRLEFLGSGLTGELGDRWRMMVVVSAMKMWDAMTASPSG